MTTPNELLSLYEKLIADGSTDPVRWRDAGRIVGTACPSSRDYLMSALADAKLGDVASLILALAGRVIAAELRSASATPEAGQ